MIGIEPVNGRTFTAPLVRSGLTFGRRGKNGDTIPKLEPA